MLLFIESICLCRFTRLDQATLLPNAFNTTILQEPASVNWNMDTGASSHLNDSVHCLNDILNMCIYPSVAVGVVAVLFPFTNFLAIDAWTYIEAIFQDNKRSCAMALKSELRNLKLGDLSIDVYFQKIESIVSILNGLGSPLSNDDVVPFTLEGLPSTYETISTVIGFKTFLLMLPTASPWFYWLIPALVPRYLHIGVHGKSYLAPSYLGFALKVCRVSVTSSDLDMLLFLVGLILRLNAPNISTPSPPVTYTVVAPPGNGWVIPTGVLVSNGVTIAWGPLSTAGGLGQATLLPNVFNTTTLQESASDNWNMDTGSEVLRRLVSSDSISCNKEKLPVLCHACQLGKHVKLPFVSSSSSVTSCFDIIHSDLWTSPILSLSGFQYYVLFLDHYSQNIILIGFIMEISYHCSGHHNSEVM
ncbi:ribonuclease H-like domain-containing protein [Tanacetum coccineum]